MSDLQHIINEESLVLMMEIATFPRQLQAVECRIDWSNQALTAMYLDHFTSDTPTCENYLGGGGHFVGRFLSEVWHVFSEFPHHIPSFYNIMYVCIYIYIYIYMRWTGHVARMEESRSSFKILTGKPTGKRPLGRPRRRWEDKIRMDLEEIGINAGNWVDSAQDRDYWRALVNAALNLQVP